MTPRWWPTTTQTTLLRAVLADGEDGVETRHVVATDLDLDALDAGSHSLLPTLHRCLTADGDAGPDAGRLQGIRRRAGYATALMRSQAEGVLERLADAGIPTVLLGGAGVAATVYGDEPALRPFDRIEVLVPPASVGIARDIVAQPVVDRVAGGGLGPGGRPPIEIRDRLWRYQFSPTITDDVLGRRVAVAFGTGRAWVPDATDQLLLSVVVDSPGSPPPPPVWALDAALLVRSGGIDWDRLVADAGRSGRAVTAAEGVGYLRDELAIAIPPGVVEALTTVATPWLARRFERSERRRRSLPGRLVRAGLTEYLFTSATMPLPRRLTGYPRALAHRIRRRPWAASEPV